MPLLLWVITFTFLGSVASLIGGVFLLWKADLIEGKTHFLVAFAAGAMLAASFLDLLPEGLKEAKSGEFMPISAAVLSGIVTFFFLERFIAWFHHHACPDGEECEGQAPTIPLLVIGDSLHNFLDGIVISSSFLLSIPVGIVASIAVFFHEIPHEMGNFGVLLHLKMQKINVLLINLLSAFFAFLGAFLAFFFLNNLKFLIPFLVAFAAGNFIYIAASDLIPELHRSFKRQIAVSQSLSFLLGILVIILAIRVFA